VTGELVSRDSGFGIAAATGDFKTVDMPPATDKVPPMMLWK
jgi:hypothetical protein